MFLLTYFKGRFVYSFPTQLWWSL